MRNRLGRTVAAVAAVGLLGTGAAAQVGESFYPAGLFYIEGVRAYCGDIETTVARNAPELIDAPNGYTIVLNGPAFNALPPGVRLFVYMQTCGMVFYGGNITLADQWAANQGIAGRWLSAADLEVICSTDLGVTANWTEAPDAARCQAIADVMRAALQR